MADCFISKIVESYIGLMLNIQYHNTKIWSPTSLQAEVGLSFYRDDPLYFISRLFIGDSFALRSNNTSSAFLFGTLISIFFSIPILYISGEQWYWDQLEFYGFSVGGDDEAIRGYAVFSSLVTCCLTMVYRFHVYGYGTALFGGFFNHLHDILLVHYHRSVGD